MRVLLGGLIGLILLAAPVWGFAAEKLTDEELDRVSAAGDVCSMLGLGSGCSLSLSQVLDGSSGTTSTITSSGFNDGGVSVSSSTSSGTSTITQTNSFNSSYTSSTSSFTCIGSCSFSFP